MAVLNQEKSELLDEISKLREELNDVKGKYELLLEFSGTHFVIFKKNKVIEFSPDAEGKFVFTSDFSTKTVEELMPVLQSTGTKSITIWNDRIKHANQKEPGSFVFEFHDRTGVKFTTKTKINVLRDNIFIATFELIEETENLRKTIQSFADGGPFLIRMTDGQASFNYFSKTWLEFTGRDEDIEIGKWIEEVHPSDRKQVLESIQTAFKKKIKYESSFRIKDINGDYRWLLETGIPRFSHNNEFIGFLSAAIDNTERKSIELESSRQQAIIESEKKIQNSLNKSKIMALTTDVDANITFCNREFLKTIGIKTGNLNNQNLFDFFEPDPAVNINRKKYQLIAKNGHFSGTLSGVFLNEKGEEIAILFNAIILKDARGQVSGITLFGDNITERRKMHKALEKTNNQLTELFDNSYDLIQIFDGQGNFQFVNTAWKEKLGYSEDDLKKLKLQDLVTPEYWGQTQINLEKVKSGEKLDRFEIAFLNKQGRNIFVSGRINCTVIDEHNVQYRGIFFDITERIRAEKAQSLYYQIANLTTEGTNLDNLYTSIYESLTEILKIKNFSIALKDRKVKNKISFPYYISEYKHTPELKKQKEISELLANYTFERKKPLIIYQDGIQKIAHLKKVKLSEEVPKIWLGVQINIANQPIGVISIHSYDDRTAFNHKDLELLYFISSQVSMSVERKFNEDKIHDQAARIKAIFESTSHQIWSVGSDLTLTAYNNNYSEALNQYYNIEAQIGAAFYSEKSKMPKKIRDFWTNKFKQAFEGKAINFENRIKDKSGQSIWRDVFINPIYIGDNTIEEVSVIANDITEKRIASQALKESEEKFRDIFESFQDIYFRCDLDGKILMASPSVEDIMATSIEDIVGRNILDFFRSEINTKKILKDLYQKEHVRNFEASVKIGKRKRLQFLCNIRLIYRNNNPIEIEGVARDITRLKRANQQQIKAKDIAEKSLVVKERFLANMSHEIRTPMNGIVGMIDLIGSTNLSPEQFSYVKTIKKSSETLLDILNDILDLSKIEAGKMSLKKKPVHLVNTFEKLYDLYSQQAHTNNTCLYYNIDDDTPEVVMLDETRLLQVLSNLTSNAIKFSESRGTINISLRVLKKLKSSYLFKVQIKDEGIGISKKDIGNLFKNFNQLDNSSTKVYSGTGLGLAISKELVKTMKGDIGVASTPGLGSTFWFTFEGALASTKQKAETEQVTSGKITKEFINSAPSILIVDDNNVNRNVAGQILIKSGCSVDLASGGKEAIEKVNENAYDLIFMDIQMPEMDGIEATKRIKAIEGKRIPPIVAMTAYSMEEDQARFLNQGLDDYMAKPVKAAALIQKVKDHLAFQPSSIEQHVFEDASQELIINQNTLNQLFKYGGQELVNSVLLDFQNEAGQQISNCLQLVEIEDIEGIKKELHTLKGSSGTLGIERLEKKTKDLESLLKENNFYDLTGRIIDIQESFKEFQENYKNILEN
ncbi:MAG: PAS domain S-box-containing protein [Bacteroidia bacterium]|jgi:PAS domain S-box-containing protein